MPTFNHYIILTLFLIQNTSISQTQPTLQCSGNPATDFCICYHTRTECKTAINQHLRSDCFYHLTHGCISITDPPTNDPTLNPTVTPTLSPTAQPTQTPTYTPTPQTQSPTPIATDEPSIDPTLSPTPITPISTLYCSDKITGHTLLPNDINYYALQIETNTDLFIDSCGSSYDTWLYFQPSQSLGSVIDCDDCGYCSLQSQLQIPNVNIGTYMIGIGGYRGDFGEYLLHITCITATHTPTVPPNTPSPTANPTHMPTSMPTDIPTPNPTSKPSFSPTFTPIMKPTEIPSIFPPDLLSKNPSIFPTNVPSYSPSINPLIEMKESDSEVVFFSKKGKKITGFELSLIFAVLLVIFVIGFMFGVKYVSKRKEHHMNISMVETDHEEESDSSEDDEIISYVDILQGSSNTNRRVNIEEMLARAKTDMMHLTEENNPFVD